MTCDLSTYSLELGEDSWQTSSSDTSPSGPSNSTPIAAPFCEPDETTDGSQDCVCMSRTSGCSIHPSTPAAWISSQAVSLARILVLLEKAQASLENGLDSGANSPASFAWYDPDSHSLKTAQCSLFADSMSSSPILPRSGSMRNGRLYPRPRLALRTEGNASGSWPTIRATDGERGGRGDLIQAIRGNQNSHYKLWQTPVADDAINRTNGKFNSRGEPKLSAEVKLFPTPQSRDYRSGDVQDSPRARRKQAQGWSPNLNDVVLWRTPTVGMLNADRAKDPEYANRKRAKGQTITLADQVKWPTPTVCGNHNRKGASATSGDGLATAVKAFATPTARDWKSGKASEATMERNSRPLSEQIGGSLNPTWVAWLMGWPMNWFQAGGIASQTSEGSLPESKTGLVNSKPSATGKSRSRQPPPGKS